MPRFFATGGSESESDSDSEREQIVARPVQAQFTVSRFLLPYVFFLRLRNFPIFRKYKKILNIEKRQSA